MFSLTTIVKHQDGSHSLYESDSNPLPIELLDQPRIKRYLSYTQTGWIVGEFNYQTYCKSSPNGDLFIFPGLIISETTNVTKRFHGYKKQFRRIEVENIAKSIYNFAETFILGAQTELNMLVHDLRALSSQIYNSTIEAERLLGAANYREAAKRVGNIKAVQGMLRMRTDALDFVGNPATVTASGTIPVYKKVDKVVRSFKSRGDDDLNTISLHATPFPSNSVVHGPDILELIPYTLIDNAMKYSPRSGIVNVNVSDGFDVIISVSSYGPKIDDDEIDHIFNRGKRGRHAVSSGKDGTGIGLHIVKKLVSEHFFGTITISQTDPRIFDLEEFYLTTFKVSIPSFRG